MANSVARRMPGISAPANSWPTDTGMNWASTISTRLGGISCASVPDATITPGRQLVVVLVLDHHGQREHTHHDHRRRHHPGRRGEQRADEHHGDGDAAAERAEHHADRRQQPFGEPRFLEDRAHEHEERDREEREVGRAVGEPSVEQPVELLRLHVALGPTDQEEHGRRAGERERDRVPDHDQEHEQPQHDQREDLGVDHVPRLSSLTPPVTASQRLVDRRTRRRRTSGRRRAPDCRTRVGTRDRGGTRCS